MEPTYLDRTVQTVTITEHSGASGVTTSAGWGVGLPGDYRDQLPVGTVADVEQRGSQVVGWRVDGRWLYRDSDQDLAAQREQLIAEGERRRREVLEVNEADWRRRESELPVWVAVRLATFHERGGERFALEGWGYELVVAELAVAYRAAVENDGLDLRAQQWWQTPVPAVEVIADREGTSGHQHDLARMLALAGLEGADLAGTPGGLTPITGDPFYQGREN